MGRSNTAKAVNSRRNDSEKGSAGSSGARGNAKAATKASASKSVTSTVKNKAASAGENGSGKGVGTSSRKPAGRTAAKQSSAGGGRTASKTARGSKTIADRKQASTVKSRRNAEPVDKGCKSTTRDAKGDSKKSNRASVSSKTASTKTVESHRDDGIPPTGKGGVKNKVGEKESKTSSKKAGAAPDDKKRRVTSIGSIIDDVKLFFDIDSKPVKRKHRTAETQSAKTRGRSGYDPWMGGKESMGEAKEKRKGKKMVETVIVNDRKYAIPVDENGYVTSEALITRLLQYEKANSKYGSRRLALDLSKTAENRSRYHRRLRPKDVAEWWANPNEFDLIGIDDANSPFFSTAGCTRESSKKYQRQIPVIGGPLERRAVRRVLDSSYDDKELKVLAKDECIYLFKDGCFEEFEEGTRGFYHYGGDRIYIEADDEPRYATILHETNHRLRYIDDERDGIYTKSLYDVIMELSANDEITTINGIDKETYLNHLRGVEEAATECETIARISPFDLFNNRGGYYSIVAGDRLSSEVEAEDRELLVGNSHPFKKGLKGKEAVDAVEEKFTSTHISEYDNKTGIPARRYRTEMKT